LNKKFNKSFRYFKTDEKSKKTMHISNKAIHLLLGTFILISFVSCAERSKNINPNIIFIMVDDLGKEWISCYGSESIKTLNIDKLAETGMQFHNAYSMAQCTPTRTSLLTGQYPYKTGWINHWDVPRWGVGYFDWEKYTTFASVMQSAGYRTAAAGKWQINDFRIEPEAMKKHGFDDWCMWTGGEGTNPPSGKRYYDAYINTPEGSKTYNEEFGPDVFTDFIIDFMKQNKENPMMIYYPMVLTHLPLTTTPDEPSVEGIEEAFPAMVRYTDKIVGKLVGAIDDLGIRENTIIIFTTDNGSPGKVIGVRNGVPTRGAKAKTTEPGLCQPFIVNCPGRVPEGVESNALTAFVDILPTFAELGGATLPTGVELDGKSIANVILGQDTEGPHQWICGLGHGPARLTPEGVAPVKEFTHRSIRDKQFKVFVDNKREIIQLYNLETDPLEENNLIEEKESYKKEMDKFQAIVDAMPQKDAWPKYRPRAANVWDKEVKVESKE